ncbi:MAG TPA: hypothetical protein VK324_07055, partial [Tepidisphaeraceae bacterium]|nr:hypothetical protein [Tepidisphaeraceae bacterium]
MSVPTLDSLLAPFARNFADRLSAEPGRFLLTPQAAAELAAVVSPYLAAAEATAARANQSPALTAVRAAAKAKLLPHLRGVYARVQASGEVAAADKLL